MKFWVLQLDYGVNGFTAPIAVFADQASANDAVDLIAAANGSATVVTEVVLRGMLTLPQPNVDTVELAT